MIAGPYPQNDTKLKSMGMAYSTAGDDVELADQYGRTAADESTNLTIKFQAPRS